MLTWFNAASMMCALVARANARRSAPAKDIDVMSARMRAFTPNAADLESAHRLLTYTSLTTVGGSDLLLYSRPLLSPWYFFLH